MDAPTDHVLRASKGELDSLRAMVDSLLENQAGDALESSPDVLRRIAELEEGALVNIQKVGGTEAYTFEDMVFNSDDDVLSLLANSLDDVDVGGYLDLVGTLSRLDDDFSSGKEYADKMRSSSAVGITPLEAVQMSTMNYVTVPFLY